jgi:hypothetical protein
MSAEQFRDLDASALTDTRLAECFWWLLNSLGAGLIPHPGKDTKHLTSDLKEL